MENVGIGLQTEGLQNKFTLQILNFLFYFEFNQQKCHKYFKVKSTKFGNYIYHISKD